jgi:hypothetical protein
LFFSNQPTSIKGILADCCSDASTIAKATLHRYRLKTIELRRDVTAAGGIAEAKGKSYTRSGAGTKNLLDGIA